MHHNRRQLVFVFIGWTFLAQLLHFGPPNLLGKVQSATLDSAGRTIDGFRLLADFHWPHWWTPAPETADNTDLNLQLTAIQNQNRDLLAQLAQLRNENQQLKQIPHVEVSPPSRPLISTELVSANVLGLQTNSNPGRSLVISQGSRMGLTGDEIVLEGNGLLLDQGTRASIGSDQLVTFGRALLGRTSRVGRWTTLVQPISDPEFRIAVRIVRQSEFGLVLGASGILQGGVPHCAMTDVLGTEPVAEGDLVYTDTAAMLSSTPIFCGTVTSAKIAPNDPHWSIEVQPHCSTNVLPTSVSILRTEPSTELPE